VWVKKFFQNILYAQEVLILKTCHATTLKATRRLIHEAQCSTCSYCYVVAVVFIAVIICATCNVISHMKCVCTFSWVLSEVCVQGPIWPFFVMPWFHASLVRHWVIMRWFQSPKLLLVSFWFHMHWISILWSLYFRIFSASFLITILSPEIAASIYMFLLHFHGFDVQVIVRLWLLSPHNLFWLVWLRYMIIPGFVV